MQEQKDRKARERDIQKATAKERENHSQHYPLLVLHLCFPSSPLKQHATLLSLFFPSQDFCSLDFAPLFSPHSPRKASESSFGRGGKGGKSKQKKRILININRQKEVSPHSSTKMMMSTQHHFCSQLGRRHYHKIHCSQLE